MHPTYTLPGNGADPTDRPSAEPTYGPTRRVDGKPETEADRLFFDLRESGYLGPIDQDGNAVTDLAIPPAVVEPVTPVVTPAVTVAVTLRAAAVYLDRHGWCQGSYYDGTATVFTPPACLVGALGMVCYGGPVDAPAQQFTDPGFADFEAAVAFLDRYLTGVYDLDVYSFNDARGRTRTDVVLVLDEAADEYDRTRQVAVGHVDYPHEPGLLYDCPACEARCYCFDGDWQCVHCAIEAEGRVLPCGCAPSMVDGGCRQDGCEKSATGGDR
jgi:hypothetical protein